MMGGFLDEGKLLKGGFLPEEKLLKGDFGRGKINC
jgi:hypothetical protein